MTDLSRVVCILPAYNERGFGFLLDAFNGDSLSEEN